MALPKPGFLRVAWNIAWPYWMSDEKWSARGLLAVVVALNLVYVWLTVGLNQWNNDFYNALQEYDWPGNVRELKNLIERIVILSKGDEITDDDVRPCLFSGKRESLLPETGGDGQVKGTSLKAMEEVIIKSAFEMSHGNQRQTAKLLDISRDTLRYRLKKMGLTRPKRKGNHQE